MTTNNNGSKKNIDGKPMYAKAVSGKDTEGGSSRKGWCTWTTSQPRKRRKATRGAAVWRRVLFLQFQQGPATQRTYTSRATGDTSTAYNGPISASSQAAFHNARVVAML